MTSGPTMNRFIYAMCHFNFRENKKETNSERQNSKIKKLKINLLFCSKLIHHMHLSTTYGKCYPLNNYLSKNNSNI